MPAPTTARMLDGRALAERLRAQHVDEVERLATAGKRPRLVVVRVGSNEAAQAYIRGQQRGAERWGIEYATLDVPPDAGERGVQKALKGLNEDGRVTGVMLALPLPAGFGARTLQHGIDPAKDVEGVHPENLGGCLYGRYGLLPCTALAVMALVEESGLALRGREAVVVGHSEIVGKPVALLLLAQDATVTVCHKFSTDLAARTRSADLLVVAVGKQGLVKREMVKPGAVVIDVGINAVPDPEAPGGTRLVGDVDPGVAEVAGWLTPVPGGVGPVTVAMLLRNTVWAARGMPPADDPGQLPLFHA
jgi:methylenetetrahydrofolate dehydrogenase (NADP+) / methenyltetrahydrofolate cyclohydrolase